MEPANGIPGKVPEQPKSGEPDDFALPRKTGDVEPSLLEPPQEDGLVRFFRRVPMYAFILFLGIVAADVIFPGVKVVVHNGGPGTMKNIAVSVREHNTPLEPILEGQEGSVRFRLFGDARVLVLYTDEAGKTRQLDAGQHRFTSMSGIIRVNVKNGKADVERQ